MIDFDYYVPTHLYFGKNREREVGKIIKNDNGHRVLLVYGSSSIKNIGLYQIIVESLKDENLYFEEINNIKPNPEIDKVIEGIKLVKEKKLDYILAVGGGSVIDTAKLIAHGYYYDGDPFDFNLKKVVPTKVMKLGVVVTIAAAGSEMSNSCVISNPKLKKKCGFNSDTNRPRFAIENPLLTFSVSKEQTAYGIIDIISHSFERYFNQSSLYCLADDFALGLIKEVVRCGKRAIIEPTNYDARATLLVASSFSHNSLTNIGKIFSFPVHALEHEVSGLYPSIAHGAGLACLLPSYLITVEEIERDKIAQFGKIVFDLDDEDNRQLSQLTIEKFKEFINDIGLSYHLKDYGFDESSIEIIVKQRLTKVDGHVTLNQDLIRKIYLTAL